MSDGRMADEGPREARVEIGHEPGRRADRIVIVGLVLVLIAIVKPWGATKPAEPASRPLPTTEATAEPTSTVPLADLPCVGGRWSIEADERWVGTVLRTWVLTDPIDVDLPSDSRITFVTVAAQQVISLGYCASFGDDAGPATQVTFFRLDPAPVVVPTTPFHMPPEAEAAANLLFRPDGAAVPGASGMSTMTWPAGRYVIRVDGPGGYRRMLGVDVRLVLVQAAPLPSGGSAP